MLLDEMEIFYYASNLKSFTKAAARLGVSKSFISKKIHKLESELKIHLMARSTRKLTLTDAGENFYRYCENIVRQGHEAYSMVQELQGKPSGKLKISMPPAFGVHLIAPMLSAFLLQFPDVSLEIELSNKLVDLLEGGCDLALRSAKLESSTLIAQKIFSIKNNLFATGNYLQTHDPLITPSDLEQHDCAIYSDTKNSDQITFINPRNHHDEKIHVKSRFASNQLDLIKHMVLADACVAVLPEFMLKEEIKSGSVARCLVEYPLPESPLYAVYPEKNFMLPKLKVFLQMLKEYLLV